MRVMKALAAPGAAVLLLVAVGCSSDDGGGGDDGGGTVAVPVSGEPVEVLLDAASRTVLGQEIEYVDGEPQVSLSIVTLEPGESTGPHHHEAPLLGWVLEGELTVDYGPDGERIYETGDSFLEAVGTTHDGRNTGDSTMRILVVNLGSDAVENTVTDE